MPYKEYKHKWYQENKERILEHSRIYRQEHKKEIAERDHKYNQNNKKKIWERKKTLYKQRRDEYMTNKSCPYCGATEDLVLHHLFPKDSILEGRRGNYNIWSWSESWRIKELLKCLVVCRACHVKIHAKHRRIYG